MFWHNKRVLITGIFGFTGFHLSSFLGLQKAKVFGIARQNLKWFSVEQIILGDILNKAVIGNALSEVKPDVIFHLAGLLKAEDVADFYTGNAGGTACLLEAIHKSGQTPTVVLVSSSAVYGAAGGEDPITEEQPLKPITHYGLSKLVQEWIGHRYYRDMNIPVIGSRPFNLLGPGMPSSLAFSAFAREIICIERGGKSEILVGNLNTRRDFTDIRDAVNAYMLLAEHGRPGKFYNVCTGRSTGIRECLEILLSICSLNAQIILDPSRGQRSDVPIQTGDPSRIRKTTGWEPKISLERSLQDLLEDWRIREEARE